LLQLHWTAAFGALHLTFFMTHYLFASQVRHVYLLELPKYYVPDLHIQPENSLNKPDISHFLYPTVTSE